jgi:hypothetical protein
MGFNRGYLLYGMVINGQVRQVLYKVWQKKFYEKVGVQSEVFWCQGFCTTLPEQLTCKPIAFI